jgi:hypothetical protein
VGAVRTTEKLQSDVIATDTSRDRSKLAQSSRCSVSEGVSLLETSVVPNAHQLCIPTKYVAAYCQENGTSSDNGKSDETAAGARE